MGKIAVMETESTREFPHTLRGIELGTVRRQEVQSETLGVLFPPLAVKSSMVVCRIVGNHHHPSIRAGADRPKVFQELPAGESVELARLTPEEKFAVAQADRPEVADALAGGMMKQNGILDLGRDPHPAARAVLLKMHFVHSPEINREVGA